MVDVNVLDVKKQAEKSLLQIEGIAGVGASKGSGDFINVYAEKATPELMSKIPPTIGGVKVRVFETGKFQSLQASRTTKMRPMNMGVSIGTINVTGTAGAIVYDNTTKAMMILSNNHVMANRDSTNNDLGNKGDIIISPGPYDGGTGDDEIGKLDRWVALNESGTNLFDAACANVDDPSSVSDVILELGTPRYLQLNPSEGMGIVKSGRSSGVSHGLIIDTNASIKVNYPGYTAPFLFEECIITTAIAIAGDSGSLCLTEDLGIIGLVFAGTATLTAVNKIDGIMKQLDINFNVQPAAPSAPAKPNTLVPMLIAGSVLVPALF